jgi:hypothetical protein
MEAKKSWSFLPFFLLYIVLSYTHDYKVITSIPWYYSSVTDIGSVILSKMFQPFSRDPFCCTIHGMFYSARKYIICSYIHHDEVIRLILPNAHLSCGIEKLVFMVGRYTSSSF